MIRNLKKIISVICVVAVVLTASTVVSFAIDYDDTYPSNIEVSACSYIKCETSIGSATVVLPLDKRKDTFGFIGNNSNVCNLTSSTVSGYIYMADSSTSYQIRFTSLSGMQYRSGSDYYNSWSDVVITSITSTNILLMDYTINGRENSSIFLQDNLTLSDVLQIHIYLIIFLLFLFFVVSSFIKEKSGS